MARDYVSPRQVGKNTTNLLTHLFASELLGRLLMDLKEDSEKGTVKERTRLVRDRLNLF